MIGCGKVQQLVRSDDLAGNFTNGENDMIKELLIAGLAFSAPSADSHLTTHYKNNTQYEQLRCGDICKKNNITDTHISYLQYEYHNAYEPMAEFLDKYKSDVIDALNESHEPFISHYDYYIFLVDELRYNSFLDIHVCFVYH